MAKKQDKMMTLRISRNLYDRYREYCEENSINMAHRLRKFMERELINWEAIKEQRAKQGK